MVAYIGSHQRGIVSRFSRLSPRNCFSTRPTSPKHKMKKKRSDVRFAGKVVCSQCWGKKNRCLTRLNLRPRRWFICINADFFSSEAAYPTDEVLSLSKGQGTCSQFLRRKIYSLRNIRRFWGRRRPNNDTPTSDPIPCANPRHTENSRVGDVHEYGGVLGNV